MLGSACSNAHQDQAQNQKGSSIQAEKMTVLQSSAISLDSELEFTFQIDENKLALGEIIINATAENHSPESVSFLKWQTPFEERMTGPVYKVSFEGEPVSYKGIMMKRGYPDASQFITLAQDQQFQQSQSIHSSYETCRSGWYQIDYDGLVNVAATNNAEMVRVKSAEALSIELTGICQD